MARRINARIDDDLAAKLDRLRGLTKASTSGVLKAAIELYYDSLRLGQRSPWEIFDEGGFIGAADGPADLSTDYKQALLDSLRHKQ